MWMTSCLKLSVVTFAVCAVLAGCMIVRKPTPEEVQALDAPPANIKAKVDHFLPRALSWYNAVEAELLPQGRALSVHEIEIARTLGVSHPEQVRIVALEEFPMPSDPELLAEAERFGLGSRQEGGRTMGYLIMLKPWVEGNATVIAHELVHVGQQARMGRPAFLRRYLVEMEMMGYARSPLELEAYAKQGHVK